MEPRKQEKLEVPSAEGQSLRREAFVEKLLNPDKPSIKAMSQSSTILNQVKAFMPKIKSANEDLEKMENKGLLQIDEPAEDEPYVEMNVQLYEDNSGTSDSDTDSTNSTVSPNGSPSSTSSSSDENDGEDNEERPQKQRKLISEIITGSSSREKSS